MTTKHRSVTVNHKVYPQHHNIVPETGGGCLINKLNLEMKLCNAQVSANRDYRIFYGTNSSSCTYHR